MEASVEEPLLRNYSDTSINSIKSEKRSKPYPAAVRLLGSPNSTLSKHNGHLPIVDIFDANNEESFSLETFQALILAARAANKDFILAKVTTVDPQNPNRIHNSYYQGHNINKVAFKAEPELGLLHRMRARNPLDNMEILGDIHYYTISPVGIDAALTSYQKSLTKKEIQNTIYPEYIASSCENEKRKGNHQRSLSDTNFKAYKEFNESSVSLNAFLNEEAGLTSNEEFPGTDILKDEMILYDLRYYGSDEDYLNKHFTREFFKKNSVLPDDYVLFSLHRPENYVINNLPEFDNDNENLISRRRSLYNLFGIFSCSHSFEGFACTSDRQILLQTLIVLCFLVMIISVVLSPPTFFISVIAFVGLLLIYQFVRN